MIYDTEYLVTVNLSRDGGVSWVDEVFSVDERNQEQAAEHAMFLAERDGTIAHRVIRIQIVKGTSYE